jgi:hypothetical protein
LKTLYGGLAERRLAMKITSTHEQRQINRVMENSACGLLDIAERLSRTMPANIDDFKSDYRFAKEQLQAIADNAERHGIKVNSLI